MLVKNQTKRASSSELIDFIDGFKDFSTLQEITYEVYFVIIDILNKLTIKTY